MLWAIISDDTAADERKYISPPFGCQPAAAEPFPPNSVAVEFLACLPLFFSLSSHSQLFDHEEKEEELKQLLGGNEREFSILNSARNILRCPTQTDAPNICLSNCKRVPTTQSVSSYTQGPQKRNLRGTSEIAAIPSYAPLVVSTPEVITRRRLPFSPSAPSFFYLSYHHYVLQHAPGGAIDCIRT